MDNLGIGTLKDLLSTSRLLGQHLKIMVMDKDVKFLYI